MGRAVTSLTPITWAEWSLSFPKYKCQAKYNQPARYRPKKITTRPLFLLTDTKSPPIFMVKANGLTPMEFNMGGNEMSDKAQHTPGAIRAAKIINDRFVGFNVDLEKEIANIIDEQTAAPDLLEAARMLKDSFKDHGKLFVDQTKIHQYRKSLNDLFDAISKAGGDQE